MSEFTEKRILEKFNIAIKEHFNDYNKKKYFSSSLEGDPEEFDHINKSCEISYKISYRGYVDFKILLKVKKSKYSVSFSTPKISKIHINAIDNDDSKCIFTFINSFEELEKRESLIEFVKNIK